MVVIVDGDDDRVVDTDSGGGWLTALVVGCQGSRCHWWLWPQGWLVISGSPSSFLVVMAVSTTQVAMVVASTTLVVDRPGVVIGDGRQRRWWRGVQWLATVVVVDDVGRPVVGRCCCHWE